jgi:hypothetical protein
MPSLSPEPEKKKKTKFDANGFPDRRFYEFAWIQGDDDDWHCVSPACQFSHSFPDLACADLRKRVRYRTGRPSFPAGHEAQDYERSRTHSCKGRQDGADQSTQGHQEQALRHSRRILAGSGLRSVYPGITDAVGRTRLL